jgi:hypothetical protein
LPKSGEPVLALISETARRERWDVNELHLESGRLDEVFRAITRPAPAHAVAARGG